MDPDKIAQWQAADALFDQWLDLPADERDAWLAGQAPSDPVRRRLLMLIEAHQRPRAGLEPAGSDLSGVTLGDWTLEEELGRGGMAVVYRAWREQGMARQEAAVKILTLGALGATGRERFHREAEILARLNHSNVTALVDSGVAGDGTCWLAMPLVDGQRIDRWCDEHALDAHAIVRLYLQVCGAVAYAHRNLVIHRDIKPSNVLVDDDGHVRLLDFGIGQFADGQGEATLTMWRALTPGYAAPEQLRGDPPSTAVDVYGLGALLHRLLTGRTPHLPTEDADTTRPSLLVRDAGDAYHRHYVPLKTDLDRVLLKALAEEPEHRYPTAEALADDLRRWLDGRPVLAEKPKPGYRLRKFVARNRMGVAAGVLLAVSLAGGVGATLWQASEARREADLARLQERRATAVRDFIVQLFEASDPNAAIDGPLTARALLDQGAHRIQGAFGDTPALRAEMLILLGDLYRRIHELDAATPLLAEGIALAEAMGDPALVVEARLGKGLLDAAADRDAEALAEFDTVERALEELRQVPGDRHGQLVMHRSRALTDLGKAPEAVAYAEAALARARSQPALRPDALFFYLRALAAAVKVQGHEQRGAALLEEALLLRNLDRLAPTERLPLHASLAASAMARGELEAALRRSSEALALAGRVYRPHHPARASLLDLHGIILTHMARFDEAVAVITESISIREASDSQGSPSSLAAAYNNLALALDNAERDAEAEPHMIRAMELAEEVFGRDDPRYAIAVANLGNLYRQAGRHDEAEALLEQGLRMRRELLGEDHPYVGIGLVQMARLRLRQGRAADALSLAGQASDIYLNAQHTDPRRLASTDEVRAVALAALGRVDEAEALLEQALADARAAGVDNGVEWPRVMAARAHLYATHRPARAKDAIEDALQTHLEIYGVSHPGTRQMQELAATWGSP